MNRRSLGALVALNMLLLAALAATNMYPTSAHGQLTQARWARGSYRMVGGFYAGSAGGRSAIYVVDNYSSKILAFVYSSADPKNQVTPIVGKVINEDVQLQGR